MDGTTYYCGVPINVQTGMLYYIESMLPDNWETDWDVNGNGTPDFFETYTALYAFSKETQEGGGKTEYGYLDELVDTYFMTGYLFTFGGYIFGDANTNPEDIGLAAGNAAQGAWMIRQWAELMNNTEIVAKDFASSAYSYLAKGKMLCTVTTPDVRSMFIKEMVNNGWTEEEAEADLKMIAVPRLPASGDLTADAWQDTITNMDELTLETKMMGGMNGYGISSYTKCPNAALAFVKFAADYEQVILRNQMLGITPARADAAATIGETDSTVAAVFDRLENGNVDIMPAINAVSQLWTPSESFFVELATDALSGNRGEPTKYDTIDKIQAGLENVCSQIYDGIFTLS